MMRLTKVELQRLFSRRLTTIAMLGALVVTGVMLFGSFQEAKPLSAPEQAAQQAQFDQAKKDWAINGEQQVQDCLAAQAEQQKIDPKAIFPCDQMAPNLANWFATRRPCWASPLASAYSSRASSARRSRVRGHGCCSSTSPPGCSTAPSTTPRRAPPTPRASTRARASKRSSRSATVRRTWDCWSC